MDHLQNDAQLHPEHTVRLLSLQTKHLRAVDTATVADRPSGLLSMTMLSPCGSAFRAGHTVIEMKRVVGIILEPESYF